MFLGEGAGEEEVPAVGREVEVKTTSSTPMDRGSSLQGRQRKNSALVPPLLRQRVSFHSGKEFGDWVSVHIKQEM